MHLPNPLSPYALPLFHLKILPGSRKSTMAHTFKTVTLRISVVSFIGFGELILVGGELFFGEDVFEPRPPSPLGMER